MSNTKPRFVAESVCVPGDGNVALVPLPRPMSCAVIFVHGVNSEGEWYHDTEQGLIRGLNKRLGRVDLKANGYKYGGNPDSRRPLDNLDLKHSPVIRFYWGYRAPKKETDAGTFKWRIPLKTRVERPKYDRNNVPIDPYSYSAYSYKHPEQNEKNGSLYYWGGGPFQNGTTALNASWFDGFDPYALGFFNVGSPVINPERYRPLNPCPKRTYYVHAAKRLAKLIDTIYDKYPDDTVAVISHSQGTMITMLAMFFVKKVPDTLFISNSPYRFSDTFLDAVQMGRKTPTAKARVKTFFNLLDRFQQAHADTETIARKTSEKQLDGVGGWVDPDYADGTATGETPENEAANLSFAAAYAKDSARIRWRKDLKVEEKHRNHGRVFVYFSPNDRVIAPTPIEGIGWTGVNANVSDPDRMERVDPFGIDKYTDMFFQRQFMRSDEVGGEPDAKTHHYPQDNRPLWDPPCPKVMDLFDELGSIDPKATVNVNAPAVPNPVPGTKGKDGKDMAGFTDPIAGSDDGLPLNQQKDFKYYQELIYDKPKWVQEPASPYSASALSTSRLQTHAEQEQELKDTHDIPTNHSKILMYQNGLLVERVLAYDLPIGRAESFDNKDFWNSLLRMADWLEEDPDYEQGGDFAEEAQKIAVPDGVDCETYTPPGRSSPWGR